MNLTITKPTIEAGFAVACVLSQSVAGLSCYVGQVEAIDEHGFRMTLIDWITHSFNGNDFFVSWGTIAAMLVATPAHNMETFIMDASRFQGRHDKWK